MENQPKDISIGVPEALIFAKDSNLASDILSHINAAMLLFGGYSPFEDDDLDDELDEYWSAEYPDTKEYIYVRTKGVSTDGVYHACKFVAKIWDNEQTRLALARYSHATKVVYHHRMDAAPHVSLFKDFDKTVFSFTSYALAITAAYSVLEELRFEPRHKQGEVTFKDGSWNDRYANELRERLRAAGVNPEQEVVWLARGAPTLVERKVAPPSGKRAPWASWNVRDKLVPLWEAILLSSRIRHRASAHGTKAATRALTPVDLINVNETCRAALLEAAGMPFESWIDHKSLKIEFAHDKMA